MRKMKQKKIPGAIAKVQIDGEYHTYARVLNSGVAFYDCRTRIDMLDLNEIISLPILFSAMVNDNGIKKGKWPIIGIIPLEEKLQNDKYYDTEIMSPEIFRIHENGYFRVATKDECAGLDVAGVWDPIHIEQRLQDYYQGIENLFVKRLDVLGNYKKRDLGNHNS